MVLPTASTTPLGLSCSVTSPCASATSKGSRTMGLPSDVNKARHDRAGKADLCLGQHQHGKLRPKRARRRIDTQQLAAAVAREEQGGLRGNEGHRLRKVERERDQRDRAANNVNTAPTSSNELSTSGKWNGHNRQQEPNGLIMRCAPESERRLLAGLLPQLVQSRRHQI